MSWRRESIHKLRTMREIMKGPDGRLTDDISSSNRRGTEAARSTQCFSTARRCGNLQVPGKIHHRHGPGTVNRFYKEAWAMSSSRIRKVGLLFLTLLMLFVFACHKKTAPPPPVAVTPTPPPPPPPPAPTI